MSELQITKKFLKRHKVCEDGYIWWLENCKDLSTFEQIEKVKNKNLSWANWLITRLMTKEQNMKYSIYAARQVIDIFEKKYSADKRPRKAIEVAENYLKNPTSKNAADAAASAADAAASAAYAAYAASAADAADAAAYAAYAADAASAASAASAAYAASAAASAADAAAYAAYDKKILRKIINYGIELLKKEVSDE
jgi:hypothetical protein